MVAVRVGHEPSGNADILSACVALCLFLDRIDVVVRPPSTVGSVSAVNDNERAVGKSEEQGKALS